MSEQDVFLIHLADRAADPSSKGLEAAQSYANNARAQSTLRGYRSDWKRFTAWCVNTQACALPATPQTVAIYLTSRAQEGRKPASIARIMSSISVAHKNEGHISPCMSSIVKDVMKGVLRVHGEAQRQATPLLPDDLRKIIRALPSTLAGIRDRAILLLGFSGAFRRSEISALRIDDLVFVDQGIEVTLRRCKEDQAGAGTKKGIPFSEDPELCPVRAIQAWLTASHLKINLLFRVVDRWGELQLRPFGSQSVGRMIATRAEQAGLTDDKISGHSLRAGFATAAARAGKSVFAIMRQTGHRQMNSVNRYVREASLFSDNAACGILASEK